MSLIKRFVTRPEFRSLAEIKGVKIKHSTPPKHWENSPYKIWLDYSAREWEYCGRSWETTVWFANEEVETWALLNI